MFELLRIAIAIVGSAAAGLWDLKTTDIPDWVCILMIVSGIAIFSVEGFMTGSWAGLTTSLAVGGLFGLFGLGMYLAGQWGGGDGELMGAIGVLLPIWPLSSSSVFPFPIAFFINVFFVGAAYTIAYAVIMAYMKAGIRTRVGRIIKADSKIIMPFTLGAIVASIILWSVTSSAWSVLIPVAVFGIPVLYRVLKVVEDNFYVRISTKKLKVDDMLGEDVPKAGLYKRHIRGLTAAEVRAVRKVKSFVMIREGVRFGPVFPLALAVTILVGDIVTFILPQIM